jgi:hypothetical protein
VPVVTRSKTHDPLLWAQIQRILREELSAADAVRGPGGELTIVDGIVRGELTEGTGDGCPGVAVEDLKISWVELGRALMAYQGLKIRIEVEEVAASDEEE